MSEELKPCPTPTHFDVTISHKDKERLIPIVNWLLEMGTIEFQWDSVLLERDQEFRLSIQVPWANNLAQIAELCADYEKRPDNP